MILLVITMTVIAGGLLIVTFFLNQRVSNLESDRSSYHLETIRLSSQIRLELNEVKSNYRFRREAGFFGQDPTVPQSFNRAAIERDTTARLFLVLEYIAQIELLQEEFRESQFELLVRRLAASRDDLSSAALASISYEYYQQSSLANAEIAALQLGQLHQNLEQQLGDEILQASNQGFLTLAVAIALFGILGVVFSERSIRSIKQLMIEGAETHELLRQSENFAMAVINSSADGIVTLDEDRRILSANESALRLFDYSQNEMKGKRFDSLFPAEKTWLVTSDHQALFADLASGSFAGRRYEVNGIRKDSTDLPLRVGTSQMFVNNEIVLNINLQDLTQLKKQEEERLALEAQLQHAQKMESLGILAGGIAHDFNNLLVSIMGYANLAERELQEDSPAAKSIIEIERAAERAADLCLQMLAYSGRGKFSVEKVDLNELVNEINKLLNISISKNVQLVFDLQDDLRPIDADKTQVTQIFMNLLTNASDAVGDEHGRITVKTGTRQCSQEAIGSFDHSDGMESGNYVFVEVSDTGAGIKATELNRIFDPFYTTKFTGRGLGLSALLGIVRGHRGGIQVSSTPGQGTTFTIYFPVSISKPTTVIKSEKNAEVLNINGSVLFVDDEPAVLEVGSRLLEQMGFDVIPAENGKRAIEFFGQKKNEISFVLLDLTMPVMSGMDTLEALKQLDDSVRVILSSGFSVDEMSDELLKEDSISFLQKPYRYEELQSTIKAITQ